MTESESALSELSMNSVKVAREIEKTVKFWELEAGNDLLSRREENEVYLASKAGETYVIFFTNGGEVGLDLSEFDNYFNLKWYNIRKGKIISEISVKGGEVVNLETPGKLEWIAMINSK